MIDSNEVRIGNLVNYNDGEYGFDDYVVIIEPHEIHTYRTIAERIKNAELNPIPITPEWLERLGLKGHSFDFSKVFTISYYDDMVHIEQYSEGPFDLPHIKYIHQLQNLYHALTGQELTVKELTPTTT